MAATMSEQEMRALIQNELTEGITSQLLNTSIKQLIDATHVSFASLMAMHEGLALLKRKLLHAIFGKVMTMMPMGLAMLKVLQATL